jgi:adenylate kinase family enzyme
MAAPGTHRRIVIVGASCSGKSTLARRLAGDLGRPHIELDALHWGPGWTPRPLPEFRARVAAAVEAEFWVADGNYSVVRDLVWPRATAIVWLNLPFPLVLARALARTCRRIVSREPVCGDNRETLRQTFFDRNSILLWVIKTHHKTRRRYRRELTDEALPGMAIFELRSRAEAEAFGR